MQNEYQSPHVFTYLKISDLVSDDNWFFDVIKNAGCISFFSTNDHEIDCFLRNTRNMSAVYPKCTHPTRWYARLMWKIGTTNSFGIGCSNYH